MNPILTSSVEAAYSHLRNKILSGSFAPGSRLVTQQVATALGLSRTPVKEALARLEAERLVIRVGSWGYTVRTLTLKDAKEIFETRMVVEVACAQIAAQNACPADLEKLERILDKTRKLAKNNKVDEFLIQSRLLHGQVAESTKNSILLSMFNQVNSLILLFAYSIVQADPGRMLEIVAENEVLVAAIKSKDEDLAGRLIRSQVLKAREKYDSLISGGRLNLSLKLNEFHA
jgi:DNA-binding GntR family transcriptional regulator